MRRRVMLLGSLGLLGGALAAGGGLWAWRKRAANGPALPKPMTPVSLSEYQAKLTPLPAPNGPLRVFHLGHSLVGRDMPLFLAQMAGHEHQSQLGWGTPLRAHWEDSVEIMGFEAENAHPNFRPAKEALRSGEYDAVIFTEMVTLQDAITWHASPHYLANWAKLALEARPDVRLYLYESWHNLELQRDSDWLTHLDRDLPELWLGEVAQGAMAWGAPPIYLIPAGQVMAAVVRAAEAGNIPGLSTRYDLFATDADGARDPIHPSDLGNYLVALTHYAVLYQRSPLGVTADLTRSDGRAVTIAPQTAAALQTLTWEVVQSSAFTGIAP